MVECLGNEDSHTIERGKYNAEERSRDVVLMMFLVFVFSLLLLAENNFKNEIRIANTVFELDTDETILSEDNLPVYKSRGSDRKNRSRCQYKITGKRLNNKVDSISITRDDIEREKPKQERDIRLFF